MTTADRLPVLIALLVATIGIGLIVGYPLAYAFIVGMLWRDTLLAVARWMERQGG